MAREAPPWAALYINVQGGSAELTNNKKLRDFTFFLSSLSHPWVAHADMNSKTGVIKRNSWVSSVQYETVTPSNVSAPFWYL